MTNERKVEADALAARRDAERAILAEADEAGKTTARHYRRDLLDSAPAYERNGELLARESCSRCGGSGHYSFNMMHGTVCFGCGGSGTGALVKVDAKTILGLERAADRRDDKRNAEAAERRQRWDDEAAAGRAEVERDYPEAFAILDGYDGDNAFIADVAARMAQYGRLVRDGSMMKVAGAVVAAHRRDLEPKSPAPTGRVVITGEVVSVKWRGGYYGETLKMLVKSDDGFKVWGTVPTGLEVDETTRGDRVEFTATVEPSDDDPAFGFFKRPAKARML